MSECRVGPLAVASGVDLRNNPGRVGSGTCVVTAYVSEESVTLAHAEGANWDPEAGKLTGIEFVSFSDVSTRLNRLKTGALDLDWVSSANVVQSALSEAGIVAELNPVPIAQSEPRYIAGDFQSSVANTFSPKLDPAETVDYFLTGPYGLADGNTQIAELAATASSPILSQEERAPLYNQIWDLTLREAMFVPICNQTNATVSTTKVTGTEDMPWVNLGIFDLRHVGMTK